MATWLNDYKNRKLSLEPLLQRGKMTVQELLVYQELLYRIQILETCQSLCKTAPVSADMKELLGHSNVGTTQIYTHLKDAQVRAAVEANPLGSAHHPKANPVTDSAAAETIQNAAQEDDESTGERAGEPLPEILPSMVDAFEKSDDDSSES